MAIAAGVAAIAILSAQPTGQSDLPAGQQQLVAASAPVEEAAVVSDQDASYVVPTNTTSSGFIPATRLTNYVVAHSEYSSPLGRRSVLSGVLADDDNEVAVEEEETPVQISISDDGAPVR